MDKSLATLLDHSEGTASVMAHGRLLLRLARRFEAIAPMGLAQAARVANYKAGKIVIHADNGAVAAKIRQLSQRLCLDFTKIGLECKALEVKVQPRHLDLPPTSTAAVKPLSTRAYGAIEATASSLPTGPLRSALEQLLARSIKQG